MGFSFTILKSRHSCSVVEVVSKPINIQHPPILDPLCPLCQIPELNNNHYNFGNQNWCYYYFGNTTMILFHARIQQSALLLLTLLSSE